MNSKANDVPRYGIDIDGVLANFIEAVILYAKGLNLSDQFPATWREWFDYDGPNPEAFKQVYKQVTGLPYFWLNLKTLPNALADIMTLPRPTVYLTARPINNTITRQWLAAQGFPDAEVVTVARSQDKVHVAKKYNLKYFIDDLPSTCVEMQEAGILPILFTQPHNAEWVGDYSKPPVARVLRLNALQNLLWGKRRASEPIEDTVATVEGIIPKRDLKEKADEAVLSCGGVAKGCTVCIADEAADAERFDKSFKGAVAEFAKTAPAPVGENSNTTVTETDLKEGYKADAGKARFDLLPWEAVEEVAKVYTFGAIKYDDNNWRKGMRYGRVLAATMRHLVAFVKGENIDKETGLLHVAHAAFGCLTLCSYLLNKTPGAIDDRPTLTLDIFAGDNNGLERMVAN
jgi:hypothetical protein